MKKEQFIKLGLTDGLADKVMDIFREELKGFIPKSRFDQVNESKKELENKLSVLNKEAEELQRSRLYNQEHEKILKDLWETNMKMKAEQESSIKDFIIRWAMRSKLSSGPYTELLISKVDLSQIFVEVDGTVTGIDKELMRLKETYPNLFDISNSNP